MARPRKMAMDDSRNETPEQQGQSSDDAPAASTAQQEERSNQSREHNTRRDSGGNTIEPATDFVTTSYVLGNLNATLDKLNPPTGEPSVPSSSGKRTFFELQKRLPDGSTRKATDDEISSEDMKNKLEQAAKYTEEMTQEQKLEWAQKQRQAGNQLYQDGKYKAAIDIYLTCLVVRDLSKREIDQEQLLLPVMNNLAQCTLQLGWYQKTEHFCTIAMEFTNDLSRGPMIAKLFFKRAKARRLQGMYKEAKFDLEMAATKLGTEKSDAEEKKTPEQKAIERERLLLSKAIKEGKKNKNRAQHAMQKVLGTKSDEKTKTELAREDNASCEVISKQSASTSNCETSRLRVHPKPNMSADVQHNDNDAPLYHEKYIRTHSTIRKRPGGPPPYERASLPVNLSYWQMYRLIMARVAQRLLDIIGEEEGQGFGGDSIRHQETQESEDWIRNGVKED